MRIPRPPPPADAFTSSGRAASVGDSGASRIGTPAAFISAFAPILEPIEVIDDGSGPTHVRPASTTAWANSAFSDRKP